MDEDQQIAVAHLLNGIAYLFKSAEYQYEDEIRLVVNGVGFTTKIDENPVIRVYIELIPLVPVLHKITLGPKVDRPDELAAAFNYKIKEQVEKIDIVISRLPFK